MARKGDLWTFPEIPETPVRLSAVSIARAYVSGTDFIPFDGKVAKSVKSALKVSISGDLMSRPSEMNRSFDTRQQELSVKSGIFL